MAKKKTKRSGDGAESSKFGRPSRYNQKFCEMLIDHMTEGGSFASFGAIADVSYQTLYAWCENHDEFLEAKQRGEVLALKFYEDLAKATMTGSLRRVTSETKFPDGSVKKEYAPTRGDSRTWGVTMRARFQKFGYSNKVELTGSGGGPLRIKNVSDMSDEELIKENAELDKILGEGK